MQTLAVRLLGDLDVDGVDVAAIGSKKARTLLWLLALGRGALVPADALVESLWPEGPPARPMDQLAVLISRLRAVLGRDRIQRGDTGYRLRYDWLDVDELDALTTEAVRRQVDGNHPGAAAAARVAMSLLRSAPTAPDLAGAWVASELAALDRLLSRSRRTAATALLSAGSWLEAVDVAADGLARDPYDEHALRLMMRANRAGGRTAAALAAYASMRERLADELGADPSAESAALHTAILRGEPAPEIAQPRIAATARLVGREDQLDRLDSAADRAREATVQIVIVEGEAGIGKTSLVRVWAARRPPSDVVLFGTCGELGRTAPLDPLVVALAAHLRGMGEERSQDLLGAEAPLLAPLLGLTAAATMPPVLADGIVGPTLLYGALATVVARLAESGLVVLVLDDAHRGGPALGQWLQFIRRRQVPLLIVATVRTPEPAPVVGTELVLLGPLDPQQTERLVGAERAEALYERSGGHPLFLTELALADDVGGLPTSLVEAVSTRCDGLGRAGQTLLSAAVVGMRVDPDLLAAVLNRPAVELLDDAEVGVRHQLLVDDGGSFRFRHALVREALSARASVARSAWLNRQVARVLARRPGADPAEVADHARRGGDLALAARSLRAAAARAAERFDHATAEALLDDALTLHPDPAGWLDRARVRTRRGDYSAAYRDVERARPLGASALEVGAWASYFDRRFEQASAFATDGAILAEDGAVRARCLTVAGRTRHAAGDLAAAENLLAAAIEGATGPDRMIASAWLGVLRSHQSRPEDALVLLRPATRPELRAEHTSAVLHALLFTGHAHALAGRPAAALETFDRYTTEVERRQVLRFEGRGTNFSGWVLRSLGASHEAAEHHHHALEIAERLGGTELRVAALEDLAEDRLAAKDVDAAAGHLAAAESVLHGDLVFGWRLRLKLELLHARSALAREDPQDALRTAGSLALRATELGVPRYASVARLLVHRARAALGDAVDLDVVAVDLDAARRAVAIEAWWWTGESAAAHHVSRWVDVAAAQVDDLGSNAGARGPALRSAASSRLDEWRTAAET